MSLYDDTTNWLGNDEGDVGCDCDNGDDNNNTDSDDEDDGSEDKDENRNDDDDADDNDDDIDCLTRWNEVTAAGVETVFNCLVDNEGNPDEVGDEVENNDNNDKNMDDDDGDNVDIDCMIS